VDDPVGDLVIRAEDVGDADAISKVVTRAFGSSREARLVEALRDSPNYVPEWSLIAISSGQVVGRVLVTYATLLDGPTEYRVASLSPLSVDPEHQGRGVGSGLVRAVIAVLDAAGEPLVVLEGSPWYYARFGFEHSVPLGITITLPDWAPAEASQVLRLDQYDPSIRGRLRYPAAFDVLDE
jgi:putative acetyltransferase